MRTPRGPAVWMAALMTLVGLAGCGDGTTTAGGGTTGAPTSETITVYTCVSDTTIQPVIERFEGPPRHDRRPVPRPHG